MLCPKGVKRYLQGSHPDRLLHAYERDPAAPGGFRPHGLRRGDPPRRRGDRAHPVAVRQRRLRRPRRREPDDREDLPDGQVRPHVPEDREHRLQRPAVHGQRRRPATRRRSASTAPPTRGATSSAPRSIWISGANVAECAPITTNYVWQARENGAKIIVVDPRITPIARTCDLFLPVKPGRDAALFNGILHLMIENDWLDHDFIERPHRRLRGRRRGTCSEWTPRRTAEVTGHRREGDPPGGRVVGHGEDQLPDARPRHRAPHPRREERAWRRSTSCWPRADRPAGLRLRDDHRPGQRPGRARARPEVRPAPRRPRHREPRAPRLRRRRLGHRPEDELPHAGRRLPTRSSARSTRGEIKGLLSICFNPVVSLPDNNFVRRMLEKLEFYVAIDFFLSETRPLRRRRAARLAARGGRGHRHARPRGG